MKYKVLELTEKGQLGEVKDPKFFGNTTFNDIDMAEDLRNYLGGNHVVFVETHPGYQIIKNSDRTHCVIIKANADTDTEHFIAYDYISNGDGYGRVIYCSSRTYKSYKGACKKVYSYLNN